MEFYIWNYYIPPFGFVTRRKFIVFWFLVCVFADDVWSFIFSGRNVYLISVVMPLYWTLHKGVFLLIDELWMAMNSIGIISLNRIKILNILCFVKWQFIKIIKFIYLFIFFIIFLLSIKRYIQAAIVTVFLISHHQGMWPPALHPYFTLVVIL